MGARTSELGTGSQSITLKDERASLYSDDFASKPYIPSPSPKSSICWPGAMEQDQCGYLTPQTQRDRIGLHNLPRTPYSRTVYSRSSSEGGGNRSLNISSTHWKQPQTPFYGDSQVISGLLIRLAISAFGVCFLCDMDYASWSHNLVVIDGKGYPQVAIDGFEKAFICSGDQDVKSRSDMLDDDFGSVGPFRRRFQKFASTTSSIGAATSHPTKYGSLWTENSITSEGFFPTVKKNLEPEASSGTPKFQPVISMVPSFNVGVSTIHSQSSEVARKILEHLDRTVPTPKEKSAELKLATAWKKLPSSEFSTGMSNGQFSIPCSVGLDFHQNSNLAGQKFPPQSNGDRGSYLLKGQTEQGKITDAVNKNTLASGTVLGVAGFGYDGTRTNTMPSLDFKKTHDSQIVRHEVSVGLGDSRHREMNQLQSLHNQINGQNVSRVVCTSAGSEVLNLQKKHPTHSSGSRRALSSISIDKPDPKRKVSFDNGSGFTFPVSASSGVLSEPPTPSVMPSFSASGLPYSKEGSTVPSYSFGSRKSSSTLVFTFPSMSTSPDDASAIKFNFGSDKKISVSFR
ncbi:hypothetical protein HHK36_006051 [Tetracentron sinense]|uniref:Uncharacterized protein n=1 Tax=Tetracentron sinense TaxID=13715 RepID=A0A834ZK42_TETSI|nr:hypothetical protein HHK36_006051 [Tetracentron sinense]